MITSVVSPKRREAHSSNGIVVKGVDDVLVRLSRCCNPVPGDKIFGLRDARPRRVGASRRLPERRGGS